MFGRKGLPAGATSAASASGCSIGERRARPARFEAVTFQLKSHRLLSVCGMIVCTCVTLLMIGGLAHPGGVTINRGITLGPVAADLFWGAWVMLGLCGLVGSVRMFLAGMNPARAIILDHQAIRGPKSPLSGKMVRIAYCDIDNARVQTVADAHFLTVKGSGMTLKVGDTNFAERDGFWKLLHILEQRSGH